MIPEEYLLPYSISNAVAIVLIFIAWKWPRVARYLFVLMFAAAAVVNLKTANTTPEVYLEYASLALLPFYANFINGWFAQHAQLMVSIIAVGQALIAFFLLLPNFWRRLGLLGAALFLTAIIPLGVGSAFPFSIWCLVALWFVWRKGNH